METDVEAAMANVYQMNTSELRVLMGDETSLANQLEDHPQVAALQKEQKQLLVENRSLAETNVAQEPELAEKKQELITGYQNAASIMERIQEMEASSGVNGPQHSPEELHALMQTAAREAEEETEKQIEEFLEKETEVEEFLAQFIPKRALSHTRRIKSDKMTDIIRAGARRSVTAMSGPPPA